MINCYLRTADGTTQQGDQTLINTWQASENDVIWIDVQSDDLSQDALKELLHSLGCNQLAIKDYLRERHPPKWEQFAQNTFILYRGISEELGPLSFAHQQLGFFIGERYLISLHPKSSLAISQLVEQYIWQGLIASPEKLALKIIHTSSEHYLNNLLSFEEMLSELEEGLQLENGEKLLSNLVNYRIKLLRLKRVFNYHQSMFNELLKTLAIENHGFNHAIHELQDVFERFERLYSLTSLFYEMCSDLVEGHISITSHQQNVSMRVLTVVTAIFVPLSFLAGLYGMNFEHIPELHFKHGYFVLLGIMGTLAVALMVLFKKKKWF